MARNIVIAKLDIDTKALMEGAQKAAREIERLALQQQKLTRSGKENSNEFKANEASLKSLTAAHSMQIKTIAAQTQAGTQNSQALLEAMELTQKASEVAANSAVANAEALLKMQESQRAAAAESKRLADEAALKYDLDTQLAALNAKKEQELASAESTATEVTAIEARYAQMRGAIEEEVFNNKIKLASTTFSSLSTILGQESTAGKAMAVAQAMMDTYQSANAAYKAMAGIPVVGPVLAVTAATAAVSAGMANVKKIGAAQPPKAEKGALFSIGGNRHSAGGTLFRGADGTQFEAEQGELIGVMNRNAARHFMAFNNAFPAGGASAPNYFAGGGIVSREMAQQSINIDELAAKIAEANRMLPPPVVAVQDIISESSSYVRVRSGADF